MPKDVDRECIGQIDFGSFRSWDNRKWTEYTKLVTCEALEDLRRGMYDGCFDIEDMEDFIRTALKYSKKWAILVSHYDMRILKDFPDCFEDEDVANSFVEMLNDEFICDLNNPGSCCGLEQAFFPTHYVEEAELEDEDVGCICFWVSALLSCPQLKEKGVNYNLIGGYSWCVLISRHPDFADKISLEELGDCSSKWWLGYEVEDFSAGWDILEELQPDFAKFRMKATKEMMAEAVNRVLNEARSGIND